MAGKDFNIIYKKPKTFSKDVFNSESEDVSRTVTTYIEDKLKDENIVIPIFAYIHPQGVMELARIGNKNCLPIAMFLVLGLKHKTHNNRVEISLEHIAKATNISLRSVVTAMKQLQQLKIIVKEGKQTYYISPKLAWFGNQVDWGIANKKWNIELRTTKAITKD